MNLIYIAVTFLFFLGSIINAEEAFIIVPVADMVLYPVDEKLHATDMYNALPCMGKQGFMGCGRVHQGLFNETVDILQYSGDEVQIALRNTFYGYHAITNKPLDVVWTLRSNIMTYEDLHSRNIDINGIPCPIDYNNKNSLYSEDIVTLILPWYDPVTTTSYSIGTRFVRSKELDIDSAYSVNIIDVLNNKTATSLIPHTHAIVSLHLKSDAARNCVVNLIRTWIEYAKIEDRFIAYIWGGGSFINSYQEHDVLVGENCYKDKNVICWNRSGPRPYTGFDCSTLILRACQIAGIPYFYKNSTLAVQYIRPLCECEVIEEGDIIWLKGHLMIVGDCQTHEIIEAVGYHKGYGYLHSLPVSKIFGGISTLEDLKNAFIHSDPIALLDRSGLHFETYDKFAILKLSSILEET